MRWGVWRALANSGRGLLQNSAELRRQRAASASFRRQRAEGGWGNGALRSDFVGRGDREEHDPLAGFGTEHLRKEKAKSGRLFARIGAAGIQGMAGVVRWGAAAASCHH